MKIFVCSNNDDKIEAVRHFYSNEKMEFADVQSVFKGELVNKDLLESAKSRCDEAKSDADLTISIEGGYFFCDGRSFACDVCCIKSNGSYYYGVSRYYEISENMFSCVKSNISLKKVLKQIESFNPRFANRNKTGVLGFLSNDKFSRLKSNIECVQNALENMKIKKKNFDSPNKHNIVVLSSVNFELFDKECSEHLAKQKNSQTKAFQI